MSTTAIVLASIFGFQTVFNAFLVAALDARKGWQHIIIKTILVLYMMLSFYMVLATVGILQPMSV